MVCNLPPRCQSHSRYFIYGQLEHTKVPHHNTWSTDITGSERVNAELPTPNTVCTAQIILLFCSVCVITMLFLLPYMYYYTFMHFIVATECTEND